MGHSIFRQNVYSVSESHPLEEEKDLATKAPGTAQLATRNTPTIRVMKPEIIVAIGICCKSPFILMNFHPPTSNGIVLDRGSSGTQTSTALIDSVPDDRAP
jgi:hypothetical protein